MVIRGERRHTKNKNSGFLSVIRDQGFAAHKLRRKKNPGSLACESNPFFSRETGTEKTRCSRILLGPNLLSRVIVSLMAHVWQVNWVPASPSSSRSENEMIAKLPC